MTTSTGHWRRVVLAQTVDSLLDPGQAVGGQGLELAGPLVEVGRLLDADRAGGHPGGHGLEGVDELLEGHPVVVGCITFSHRGPPPPGPTPTRRRAVRRGPRPPTPGRLRGRLGRIRRSGRWHNPGRALEPGTAIPRAAAWRPAGRRPRPTAARDAATRAGSPDGPAGPGQRPARR